MKLSEKISTAEMTKAVDQLLDAGGMMAVSPMTIRGVDYPRVFDLSSVSLRDVLAMATAETQDKTFMVYEKERYTIAQTWQIACKFADILQSKYNIGPGDRVALAMRNYPEWCTAYLGIMSTGATVVPINAWWKSEEIQYALEDCGAKIVIGDAKRLGYLAGVKAKLGLTLIAAREASAVADADYAELISQSTATQMPTTPIDPESDFCILYTSGSTGKPKGALLTHRSIVSAILSWSCLLEAIKLARPGIDIAPENGGALLALPLFHVTGANSIFLLSFLTARKLVFLYRWDARTAIELIDAEKLTNFTSVPTMSKEIIDAAKPGELSTLIDITTGGAKRPASQAQAQKDKLPSANVSSGYGLTETNALGCHNFLGDYLERPESTGRVVPPVTEIKIFDPEGKELAAGEVGEVCIKSPACFRGYLNLPDQTAKALSSDGWFHTGDLGKIDEDGFVYIVDRLKDLIIRGGENISCLEVESAIHDYEDTQEVTVFSVPDDRFGEIVGAVIYPKQTKEFDCEGLIAVLAKHLAGYKLPEKIWISPQQLPRGTTGKIDKNFAKKTALNFPPHYSA
ncbi:MAG: class I adenylate-forming enzyme family protein [Parvularculaceae bacterium]